MFPHMASLKGCLIALEGLQHPHMASLKVSASASRDTQTATGKRREKVGAVRVAPGRSAALRAPWLLRMPVRASRAPNSSNKSFASIQPLEALPKLAGLLAQSKCRKWHFRVVLSLAVVLSLFFACPGCVFVLWLLKLNLPWLKAAQGLVFGPQRATGTEICAETCFVFGSSYSFLGKLQLTQTQSGGNLPPKYLKEAQGTQ